jgi:diaminohydroxyphosphoribosylaminopyrimidine deaminase / 5-amino-6-(5-phosphoribosylamino)uracil reductase
MFIDDAYAHLESLSLLGSGLTSPNPNVAAAIYSPDGNLISDGFHNKQISDDHAEIVAIKSAGKETIGSTLVVSLEPCAHSGSTPPCTDAILKAGIKRVIYAVKDPNPVAAGGHQRLLDAGIEIEFIPSQKLVFTQRAWLHKIEKGRPLIVWKIAATLDGKIAAVDGTSKWITNEESRKDVQLVRSQSDAILVGTNTVKVDDPHLIPRGYQNRPMRIIFGEQELEPSLQIFDGEARTFRIASKSIPELTSFVKETGINQVLVEAGPTLGTALLEAGLIDEIIFYQAPKILGAGKDFVNPLGITTINESLTLNLLSSERFGDDLKNHYEVVGG